MDKFALPIFSLFLKGKRLEEPDFVDPVVTPAQSRLVRIAVLIPALNEERTIAKVIVKAKKFADYVIVCDDGSRDMTEEIARSLGVEVVKHSQNEGYGAALRTLFTHAHKLGVDIAVTLDGDGQHDPSYVSEIVRPIVANEADVVIGTRFKGTLMRRTPLMRRIGIRSLNRVTKVASGQAYTDSQSGMRAYRVKVLKELAPTEMGMGASTEILMRASDAGLRIVEVGIPISYDGSKSSQNPSAQWLEIIGTTIKYLSIRHPLKLYGTAGAIFLSVGFAFGLWTLDGYLASGRVTTNTALVSVASLIVGLILSVTAIILFSMIALIREHLQHSVQ